MARLDSSKKKKLFTHLNIPVKLVVISPTIQLKKLSPNPILALLALCSDPAVEKMAQDKEGGPRIWVIIPDYLWTQQV